MTRVDSAQFGALLAALWAAHDLADHVVQTDHQAAHKATSWRAMAGHVGSYHAVQLAALLALRGLADVRPSWWRTTAAVLLSASTHAFLDRRWPVYMLLAHTGSLGFAQPMVQTRPDLTEHDGEGQCGPLPLHGPYLADQALHHAVLAVCAAVLAGRAR